MKKTAFTKCLMALLLVLLALSQITVLASPDETLTVDQLMNNPSRGITRGEFAMLLNTCLELPEGEGAGFNDVPENHPYASAILAAQAAGYIKGDGKGNFRPDAIISGAEAAVCVNFFLGFDLTKTQANTLTTVPVWAKSAVSNLLDLHMVALETTDKKALTVADAANFATALVTAMMFRGSPYALKQVHEKDDFYGYNNRQYLATATLQPGYPMAMAFLEPDFVVQDRIGTLLAEILSTGGAPGSDSWKINELHKMYMDEAGRRKSLEKIMPVINEIKAVQSIAELNALAAKYYTTVNLQGFYDMTPCGDMKMDATKWCAVIGQGTFMLGSRDYYADDMSLVSIQEALKNLIAANLAYVGETENLESRAAAVFAMEKDNALASMPAELLSDPDTVFTKTSWADMDKITIGSNTLNYSPEIRVALKTANVYCASIDYIKHIEAQFTEANLAVLKDFAILNVINAFSGYLGDDFADLTKEIEIAMMGEALGKMSLELRAQMLVTSLMSSAFSKLYAEKYVTPAIKTDITQIVELIRAKYRERIAAADWMSDATRQKAIDKLNAIKTYIAYPDSYQAEYNVEVKAKTDGGNLIDYQIDGSKAQYKKLLEDLKKPINVSLWDSTATFTVNAYYSSMENAIIIPAGIIQEPFYSKDAKREANLGGLGAVIAHEFSHAFDNKGAQFDKNGTMVNWWTDADYTAFTEMTGKVSAALSDIKFVGEQSVNGVLCTGETVADLGAIACVLDIADDMDNADLALLMRSWAGIWAAKMSPEVATYFLATDEHAPHKVRVNFTLSQFPDFYKAFGINQADGMYVAPEDRITIW